MLTPRRMQNVNPYLSHPSTPLDTSIRPFTPFTTLSHCSPSEPPSPRHVMGRSASEPRNLSALPRLPRRPRSATSERASPTSSKETQQRAVIQGEPAGGGGPETPEVSDSETEAVEAVRKDLGLGGLWNGRRGSVRDKKGGIRGKGRRVMTN